MPWHATQVAAFAWPASFGACGERGTAPPNDGHQCEGATNFAVMSETHSERNRSVARLAAAQRASRCNATVNNRIETPAVQHHCRLPGKPQIVH